MRPLLFFLTVLLPAFSFGQSDLFTDQHVRIRIDSSGQRFSVHQELIIVHRGTLPLDSLQLEWWLPAWQDKHSLLAREMLYEQNTDLHFAHSGDKGLTSEIEVTIHANSRTVPAREVSYIPLGSALNPGDTLKLELRYRFVPPDRKFTGVGRDEKTVALAHALVRVADFRDGQHRNQPANLRSFSGSRQDKIQYEIENPDQLPLLVAGRPGIQRNRMINGRLTGTDVPLLASAQFVQFEIQTAQSNVQFVFSGSIPEFDPKGLLDRMTEYIESYYGAILPAEMTVLLLDKPGYMPSRPDLLVVQASNDAEELESRIIEAFVGSHMSHRMYINALQHPAAVVGLAHFHRYDYLHRYYPDRRLFRQYAHNFAARFMDVDHVEPTYLHRWLYLYMARQGLDQSMSDSALSLSRLNLEAVTKGKAALAMHTLRGYAGDVSFRRGMHRWMEARIDSINTPEDMLAAIQYFANRDLSWFLGDLYQTSKVADYALLDVDQCSYLVLADVVNRGDLAIPYSTVGYDKNGQPVLEEWHDGHLDKVQQVLHLETYRSVQIDPNRNLPDLNGQNHYRRVKGPLSGFEPIRLQFYTGLDQPDKTQIYWFPSLKFNAYDGVLAGVAFYNKTLLPKRWEYKISPEYSTRTGSLTGLASLHYLHPRRSGAFHAIEGGIYGRYFHYNEGLAYGRLSPSLNFHFRKPHPRSEIQYTLKLRGVGVDREQTPENKDLPPEVSNARYWVADLRLIRENQSILNPSNLEVDLQYSERFARTSVSYLQRFMLPNRQWMGIRIFGGGFLFNEQPDGQPFFAFGMSGTQDYLFDYAFIGRSDQDGIWSQQFFVSDGGFKSATGVYSDTWMTSLSLNVPIWKGIGVFGDLGYSGTQSELLWDYGFRLALIPDFLEMYFPIQSSQTSFVTQSGYASSIRFILNINQNDIVQRLRRGWY